MKFYICARYGRREEAQELAEQLLSMGHEITSSWLWQAADEMYTNDDEASIEGAVKDRREVKAAGQLICLSEEETNTWGRGGRHVEFGIAAGTMKIINVIGPKENLFHYLPNVQHFDSIDDFIAYQAEIGDEYEITDLGEAGT